MAIYPLRFHHNSVPVSVQTLCTYMLGLLNPICLWFTRMIIEPGAAVLVGATQASNLSNSTSSDKVSGMAYSRIYGDVRHFSLLTSDAFWAIASLFLGVVSLVAVFVEVRTAMSWRLRAKIGDLK